MLDYIVDHSGNKKMTLMRFIAHEAKRFGGFSDGAGVYIFPILLFDEYRINLQTIQSVLTDLEEREHIEITMRPNHRLTDEQRLKRDDEEDYYSISVNKSFYTYYEQLEATAEFHSSDIADHPQAVGSPHDIKARLTFTNISKPTISTDIGIYTLPSMRDGAPFNVVSYCIKYQPNKLISLDNLKAGLKENGMNSYGIANLRETMRKSLFGDVLSPFIEVSPKAIRVLSTALLSDRQFQTIVHYPKK